MEDRSKRTAQDQKLLEEIERALVNSPDGLPEGGSFSGFCARLASTAPKPDPGFQSRLGDQLANRWRETFSPLGEAETVHDAGEVQGLPWIPRSPVGGGRIGRTSQPDSSPWRRRRPALVGLAVLVMAVLMVAFVPPVKSTVLEAVKRILIGPNTEAMQVDPQTERRPRSLPPDMWIVRTEIGNFGGNAPPGVAPTVFSTEDFGEAQARTDFHLQAPTKLPEGYTLREAKLAPIGGTSWALLFYSGPGHDIIVVQMPVGPRPSDVPGTAVFVKSGILTDGTLEEVAFDGRPAAWVDGHALLWESDGISYEVGGLDLDLQQAMAIARSLR